MFLTVPQCWVGPVRACHQGFSSESTTPVCSAGCDWSWTHTGTAYLLPCFLSALPTKLWSVPMYVCELVWEVGQCYTSPSVAAALCVAYVVLKRPPSSCGVETCEQGGGKRRVVCRVVWLWGQCPNGLSETSLQEPCTTSSLLVSLGAEWYNLRSRRGSKFLIWE